MVQLHFGFVVFNEGTGNQNIRPLVAASLQGLEAQAFAYGLRLQGHDYVSSIDDLEDHDEEMISEKEYTLQQRKEAV